MKRWLAMAVMSAAVAAWAQATPLHAKVSVNWDRLAVEDALRDLGAKANVEFEFDETLVEHLDPVTLMRDDLEAGRIAMRILRPRGLTLENADSRRVRVVKADPYDELRPKREEVFEFARWPTLTRAGDDVTIAFETKGWCDVTIAIEHADGRILRHLVSGVLGVNAPEPFQWNSKTQTVVWDGKDDAGAYVDDKDAVTVRVSLGLKPRFERTLYWSPHKTRTGGVQAMASAPEGVYVFGSGRAIDHIRLFDHKGRYRRTVYPFPAGKIGSIPGMVFHTLPDGPEIPVKLNHLQTTFLASGDNCDPIVFRDGRYATIQPASARHYGMDGAAGFALTASAGRMALVGHRFSRFAIGEGRRHPSLHGPTVVSRSESPVYRATAQRQQRYGEMDEYYVPPWRAALSPDGRWMYLARHVLMRAGHQGAFIWRHDVKRIAYEDGETVESFAGGVKTGNETGQFDMPADVACDSKGRVYVADHRNDRIQVFDAGGKHLRNIPVKRPVIIQFHPKTDALYVFSWAIPIPQGSAIHIPVSLPHKEAEKFFRLTKFSALDDDAREIASWDLQAATGLTRSARQRDIGPNAVIAFEGESATVWLTPDPATRSGIGSQAPNNIMILRLQGDTLEKIGSFHEETVRAVRRAWGPKYHRQRLCVNPVDGSLYVGEQISALNMISHKSIQQAMRINPDTGRLRPVDLPFDTESMAFDRDGHVYLRSSDLVVRYDSEMWREIPFDYGEERTRVGFGGGSLSRSARQVISGAVFPGNKHWHQGEMHVNVKGQIVVGALYSVELKSRTDTAHVHESVDYQPAMYPGRFYDPGGRFGALMVHVMDRHGKMLHSDAVPGLINVLNGVALDAQGDLYFMTQRTRAYNGAAGFNPGTGTLIKGTPGQVRLLSSFGSPVPMTAPPARAYDLMRMAPGERTWVEGAHWFYGGVGYGGANISAACTCWNARFALDYFARSFTPEIDRYNVGVLDANGNLILRVGQYGNVDDGLPLVKDGGPPKPRSIGGDEVALMHPAYVGVHTDHRLFIADPGNARIVSVKLGYHADATVALRNVPDEGE